MELAFKPISVNYTINLSARDMYNEIIFKNSESYQRIIEKFAAHIANRYGMEEIEKWYFELWKDDRWNMLEEDGPYFSYFECSYNALKNISPKIKSGEQDLHLDMIISIMDSFWAIGKNEIFNRILSVYMHIRICCSSRMVYTSEGDP